MGAMPVNYLIWEFVNLLNIKTTFRIDSICEKITKKENIWSESVNSCPKLPRFKMIIKI